jgi:hypothetical protein
VLRQEMEHNHVGHPTIFFCLVEELTQWRDAVPTRSDSCHEPLAVASGRLVVLFQ